MTFFEYNSKRKNVATSFQKVYGAQIHNTQEWTKDWIKEKKKSRINNNNIAEESANTPLIQCPILREDLVQTVGETCRGSLLKNNRYIACDDSCLVNIPFAVLCKTFCVYGYNIHDYINTSIYVYIWWYRTWRALRSPVWQFLGRESRVMTIRPLICIGGTRWMSDRVTIYPRKLEMELDQRSLFYRVVEKKNK